MESNGLAIKRCVEWGLHTNLGGYGLSRMGDRLHVRVFVFVVNEQLRDTRLLADEPTFDSRVAR